MHTRRSGPVAAGGRGVGCSLPASCIIRTRQHTWRRPVLDSPAVAEESSSGSTGQPHPRCWLIGAGLGPLDYMTMKSIRLIKEAEIIVYDDLGTQDALGFASEHCEKIYVGKRGGRPSIKQPEIDRILVEACGRARRVVRLKGGDPAVFSRVSSEAAALAAAGVAFEMVPGVSSALAAPLLAGLPLTDAKLGFSFAVVSGHDVEGTNWAAFAQIPTVVILMAGKALPVITQKLMGTGWMAETPVVVVKAAGLPTQEVWRSTLGTVTRDTEGQDLSPCVVTVGQVAGLPAQWAGPGPLV